MIISENILINTSVELLYICDANKEHAERIKTKYALSARTLGLEEFDIAFQDPKVHGVIVGTPTGQFLMFWDFIVN